jgi:hypothetical protein
MLLPLPQPLCRRQPAAGSGRAAARREQAAAQRTAGLEAGRRPRMHSACHAPLP